MTVDFPRLPRHHAGNRRSSIQTLKNRDPVQAFLLREDTHEALNSLNNYGLSAGTSEKNSISQGTTETPVTGCLVFAHTKPLTEKQQQRALTGRCLRQAQIDDNDTVVMRDMYFEVLDGPLMGSKYKVESCGIFPGTSPFFTYKIVYKDSGKLMKDRNKSLDVELIYSWVREEVTIKDVRDFIETCGGRRSSLWFTKEGEVRSKDISDREKESHVLTHASYLRMQSYKKELLNFVRYCVLDGYFFSDRGMLLRSMLRLLTNCGRRDTFLMSNPKEFEWAATVITELPFILSSVNAMQQCGIVVAALEIRPSETASREYKDRLIKATQALKKFVVFNELNEKVISQACRILTLLDEQCTTDPRKPFLRSDSFNSSLEKSAVDLILQEGKLLTSFGPPYRKLFTYYSEAKIYVTLAKLLLSENHIEWHIVSKLPWESVAAVIKDVLSEYKAHVKVIVPDNMKSKLEMVKRSFPITVELMSTVAKNYHEMKSAVIIIMFAEELDPTCLLELLSGCAEVLRKVYAIVDISQANLQSIDADYSKIAVDFLTLGDVESGVKLVRHKNLPLMKSKPEPQLAFGRECVFDFFATSEALTRFFNHQVRKWDGSTAGGNPIQYSSSLKDVLEAYLSASVPQDSYCMVSPNNDPEAMGIQIREGRKLTPGCLAFSRELNSIVSVVSFVHTDTNINKYMWNERCYVYCFMRTFDGNDIHHTLPQGDLTPHFAYDVHEKSLPSMCNTVIFHIPKEIPKMVLLRWILIAKHRVLLVGPRSAILKSLVWRREPRPLSTLLQNPHETQALERPAYAKDCKVHGGWVTLKEELYFRDQETINEANFDRAREAMHTLDRHVQGQESVNAKSTKRRRKESVLIKQIRRQSTSFSNISDELSFGSSYDNLASFKDRKTGAVPVKSILQASTLHREYSKSVDIMESRTKPTSLDIDISSAVRQSIDSTEQIARNRVKDMKKRDSIVSAFQAGSVEDYLDSRAQELYKPLSILELKAKHGINSRKQSMITVGSLRKSPRKTFSCSTAQ